MEKFFKWLVSFIVDATCFLEIKGHHHVPEDGSCIIVSNHLGRLDVLLGYKIIDRSDIILTIAEKYEGNFIFRAAAKALDAIFINRYEVDFSAVRSVIKRLNKGGIYLIAPEGTRSSNEALVEGKFGAAFLAEKTNSVIVPVALTGTEDRVVKSNIKKLRRSRVTVTVGEPFYLPNPTGQDRNEQLQNDTDEIMCRIASLLPVKYRGFYTDHPRLKLRMMEYSESHYSKPE